MRFQITSAIIYLLIFFIPVSCKKFVEVGPPRNQLVTATVFESDETAQAAVTGIYSNIISGFSGFASGTQSIALLTGMAGDEYLSYAQSTEAQQFYTNSLLSTNSYVSSIWSELYKYIYASNSVIEGLQKSTQVTQAAKIQLEGEVKFIRAFCDFYLVNLFGDIPLAISSDYRINNTLSRSPVSEVYSQVIQDLKDAKELVSDAYPTTEKIRPNKAVVTAFLARVYLYAGKWEEAESAANEIIISSAYSLNENPNDVFLKNSTEAIWQLQAILPPYNVFDGFILNLSVLGGPNSFLNIVSLRDEFVSSFEPGDSRRTQWVDVFSGDKDYFYPFKYKVTFSTSPSESPVEYLMVLRLAEQYLIRAEARLKQNKLEDGISDLNVLRTRARFGSPGSLPDLSLSATGEQAQLYLEHERKMELFSEWGHRWFDVKRWQKTEDVLKTIKSPNWQITDTILPVPQSEILSNPKLEQNEGYE